MMGKSCSDTEAAKWAKECLVHATLSRCTAAHTHTHTHGDSGVTKNELRAFLARWSEHFSPLFRWYCIALHCNALQTTAIHCTTVDACFCATLVAVFKASLPLVSVYVCDMSVYDMAHRKVRHDLSMCVICVRYDSYPCVT